MVKIECYCLFDITHTGITGQVKNILFPHTTRTNVVINNNRELTMARNKQRNFDTLLQLIGMRTQIFDISTPELITDTKIFENADRCWRFEFEIEPQAQWTVDGDDFWVLKQDSDGTPMIVDLDESPGLGSIIDATGKKPNILYCYAKNK